MQRDCIAKRRWDPLSAPPSVWGTPTLWQSAVHVPPSRAGTAPAALCGPPPCPLTPPFGRGPGSSCGGPPWAWSYCLQVTPSSSYQVLPGPPPGPLLAPCLVSADGIRALFSRPYLREPLRGHRALLWVSSPGESAALQGWGKARAWHCRNSESEAQALHCFIPHPSSLQAQGLQAQADYTLTHSLTYPHAPSLHTLTPCSFTLSPPHSEQLSPVAP